MCRINLTNVISFHLPSCLPHASTFRVIWSSWSPRLASSRNIGNALHVLHPLSRRSAAISISTAAVLNFLLSDRRPIRRRRLHIMPKTLIMKISRKVATFKKHY